jgi:TPR repeat protein
MGTPIDYYYGGTTLLGHAVLAKNLDFIKYLVDKGANVNVTVTYNQRGNTFTYTQEQGMGFQMETHTAKLMDYAKKINAGDNILEYLTLTQAKQAQAIAALRQKAEQGDAESQYQLAEMYRKGENGLTQSGEDAFKWYEKAAKQEHAEAMYNIGLWYVFGNSGVKKM